MVEEKEVDLSEIFSHDDDDEAQHVISMIPITGPPGGSPTAEVAETERWDPNIEVDKRGLSLVVREVMIWSLR